MPGGYVAHLEVPAALFRPTRWACGTYVEHVGLRIGPM